MHRTLKLGVLGAMIAVIAAFGLLLRGGGSTPVSAQVPVTNCATLGGGGETCNFSNPVAINNSSATAATITIAVNSPAGVTITAASASDTGGHSCTSSGTGTATAALTCGTGLNANGTITVTFSQAISTITATVTYNANQTQQSALTASCSLPSGANGPAASGSTVPGTAYTSATTAAPPGPCAPSQTGNSAGGPNIVPGGATGTTVSLGCTTTPGAGPASVSGTFSCSNTLNTTVTAGNQATVTVQGGLNAPYDVAAATNPAGTCPLVQTRTGATTTPGTLPSNSTTFAGENTTLTYQCGAGQSIPSGTTINVSGTCNPQPGGCSGPTAGSGPSAFQEGTGQNIGCSGQAQPSPCAAFSGPSSQIINFNNLSVTPTATPVVSVTATASPSPTSTVTSCATVTYLTGWNLVGGPNGTVLNGAVTPLYTFQAADSNYETVNSSTITNSVTAAEGFWAFFNSTTTVNQPCVTGTSVSVTLPANHFIQVGNPFNRTVSISASSAGALAITFNTSTNSYGSYVQIGPGGSMQLAVGQAAWVIASGGGTLTVS